MKLLKYHYPLSQGISDFDRWLRPSHEGFGRLFQLADRLAETFPTAASTGFEEADLFEDQDHYFVRLEIPGVKKEDLQLEIHDSRLSIAYERKLGSESEASPSKRLVTIPEGIESEKVEAKLEDGVLTVVLPKSPEVKPIQIEVS